MLVPSQGMHGRVYKRRTPERSDLDRIAYGHFEEYKIIYPERYEEDYDHFRKIITATICKYINCGIYDFHHNAKATTQLLGKNHLNSVTRYGIIKIWKQR